MAKRKPVRHKIYHKDKKWKIGTAVKKMGSKTEPYYETEEEMLKEKVYDYESLSESEKEIYDKGKKT